MPEHPLLPLPEALPTPKPPGRFGAPRIHHPTKEEQAKRLGARFARIEEAVSSQEAAQRLRADPTNIVPERALVFEVARDIQNFRQAAELLGFLPLGEEEAGFEPSEYFYLVNDEGKNTGEPWAGRFYYTMPSDLSLKELISLWEKDQSNAEMPIGCAPWKHLFSYLHGLRPWGPEDRLPEHVKDILRGEISLEQAANRPNVELELSFHPSEIARSRIQDEVIVAVEQCEGEVLDSAVIPEIRYHALLVCLPQRIVREWLQEGSPTTSSLLHLDSIWYIRPQAAAFSTPSVESTQVLLASPPPSATLVPPVAALIDGVPMENHPHLAGRLAVDDPDDLAQHSIVENRTHGTAMASLIIHGDLNLQEAPLERTLHVAPVMLAPRNGDEHFPAARLILDVIYRAVHRMKDIDGKTPPTAEEVFLINLSLGDKQRPFTGKMSPWARLLDFLASRYRLLFLVSAGNITEDLLLPYPSSSAYEDAKSQERQVETLNALKTHQAKRTLLSPAEGMNGITVGALHKDAVQNRISSSLAIDPYLSENLPNISSALGLGYRKNIKPDLLMDGGRERVLIKPAAPQISISPSNPGNQFGLRAAAPGTGGQTWLIAGTSAATALVTRTAHRIFDALLDRQGGSLLADLPTVYYAVVVKALLMHSAYWPGEAAQVLHNKIFHVSGVGKHTQIRDGVSRLLGYGVLDPVRAMECAQNRATLVGWGSIGSSTAKQVRIPLPPSLENQAEFRALTLTLAWLSPINPNRFQYRQAKLKLFGLENNQYSLEVKREPDQPNHFAIERGTCTHARFEGEQAAAFANGGYLSLGLECTSPTDDSNIAIPYGLVVSLEVAQDSSIHVYDEVRARLQIPTGVSIP